MNTMKTFLLMAAMTALFMVAGQAMGGQQGMTMALLLAVGLNFFAYWNSDKLALRMNGAREVSENEAADLHAMVAMLAQRAGIPKPRVYVVDNPTPNAFATGRNPAHAAVGVLGFAMACVFATFYAVATKAEPEHANEVAGLMIMAISAGAVSGPVCGAIVRAWGNPHLGMLFVAACVAYMLWASIQLKMKN